MEELFTVNKNECACITISEISACCFFHLRFAVRRCTITIVGVISKFDVLIRIVYSSVTSGSELME